jgi:hypothetical protein
MKRLEVSGAVRPIEGSLGVKGITPTLDLKRVFPPQRVLQLIYIQLYICLRLDTTAVHNSRLNWIKPLKETTEENYR